MATVTAYLSVDGAEKAIEYYGKVFGAKELSRIPMDGGRIGHAELQFGDTVLFLSDEAPDLGVYGPLRHEGSDFSLVIQVNDSDAVFERAIAEGGSQQRPMSDEFYGRSGWVTDPFGVRWNIYTPPAASH